MNWRTTGLALQLLLGLLAIAFAQACSGRSADALFAQGNKYFDQNLIPEATVQYKRAIQADPKRGDIRSKLADAYLRQRDFRSALQEAVKAADLLPTDVNAQIRAGNLLLMAGAFEDAKGRADKAQAIDPKSVDAIVLRGNALAELTKLEDALREYQEALALNPNGDQVYANIGNVQFSRGHLVEAEAAFRKAVDVAPKSVNAHLALAGFLWAGNRRAESETVFKVAVKLEPTNLAANRALGTFYLATGRGAEAEPYFKALAATINTGEAQLALADYYLAQARPDDARAILTPLLKKAEWFGPASLRLASIELNRNNRGVAVKIVRDVLNKTPKYAEARVFDMRLQLLDNQLDQAKDSAAALIRDEPDSPAAAEAYFVIGTIEGSRDRTDEAVKAYEQALKIQQQSISTALSLAELHLKAGRADKAEAYARQALATQPKSPNARAILVRSYLVRNDVAKAAAELASLEKDYPNSPPVLNLMGARDLVAGKFDAARASYAKAAAAAPSDLDALQGLVTIDLRTGKKKDAVDRVEAALKRVPASADLYVMAAEAHFAAGEMLRGEELLKQAIQREPTRLVAYNLLGQMYVSQGRQAQARIQFQELLKRDPRSVPINTMLGILSEAQRDLPGAEAQYQKALAIDPTAVVAANNLAWLYASSNRNLDQALQLAQTAQRSLPDDPHINDTIGWIYYRKGLYDNAITRLELSLQRDATDPAVHYHLGMAYVGAGRRLKGRAALEKALSMSTAFEGADEAKKTLASLAREPGPVASRAPEAPASLTSQRAIPNADKSHLSRRMADRAPSIAPVFARVYGTVASGMPPAIGYASTD